jgi:hypothetical protein
MQVYIHSYKIVDKILDILHFQVDGAWRCIYVVLNF